MKRAVFLDRDGVLNEPVVRDGKPYPPAGPDDVILSDGAPQALAALKRLGYSLVCVTNQPDVARGTLAAATLDAINARLMAALPLDAIYDCRHDDADACACRKPKPGLILNAAADFGIDPRAQLSGRRSLARHRSRSRGALPNRVHRSWVLRAR